MQHTNFDVSPNIGNGENFLLQGKTGGKNRGFEIGIKEGTLQGSDT